LRSKFCSAPGGTRRPKTEHPDIAERDRPRKQKGHFQIEDDEQDRHQIIADIEPHPGIAKRVESAFIGRQLFRVGPLARNNQRGGDHCDRYRAGNGQKDEDREVLAQ
jgi:hypothetical protein